MPEKDFQALGRFREDKPSYNLDEGYPLRDVYSRIEVGSEIVVSERWTSTNGSKNPQTGLEGKVYGFSTGIQGLFNVDYMVVGFLTKDQQAKDAWLYTLDIKSSDDQAKN